MADKITLEKLAELVAQEFVEMSRRMAAKDDLERLREEVLANLRLVDERISLVQQSLIRASDHRALATRMDALEAQVSALARGSRSPRTRGRQGPRGTPKPPQPS